MIAKPLGANIYKEWLKMCDYVSHSLGYSCVEILTTVYLVGM